MIRYRRALDIGRVCDEQDPSERRRMRRIIASDPHRPLVTLDGRYKLCMHYPVGFGVLKCRLMLAGEHQQGKIDRGRGVLNEAARAIPRPELWAGFR